MPPGATTAPRLPGPCEYGNEHPFLTVIGKRDLLSASRCVFPDNWPRPCAGLFLWRRNPLPLPQRYRTGLDCLADFRYGFFFDGDCTLDGTRRDVDSFGDYSRSAAAFLDIGLAPPYCGVLQYSNCCDRAPSALHRAACCRSKRTNCRG